MTSIAAWFLFFPFFSGLPPSEYGTALPYAAKSTCQPAKWSAKPVLKSGLFVGDLEVVCSFTQANGGGLKAVAQSLEDSLAKTSDKVHTGPLSEKFENLPSVYYEVTRTAQESAGSLTITSDNHIATDQVTKLISVTVSKVVKGTSNMAYMKKLDGRLELVSTGTDTYELKITSHTEVSKPWFAPDDYFVKEVSKQGMTSFEKKALALASDFAGLL